MGNVTDIRLMCFDIFKNITTLNTIKTMNHRLKIESHHYLKNDGKTEKKN